MYVTCSKHLEEAIDEFIDAFEQPPDLYELETITFTEWTAPSCCHYCDNNPKYLIV